MRKGCGNRSTETEISAKAGAVENIGCPSNERHAGRRFLAVLQAFLQETTRGANPRTRIEQKGSPRVVRCSKSTRRKVAPGGTAPVGPKPGGRFPSARASGRQRPVKGPRSQGFARGRVFPPLRFPGAVAAPEPGSPPRPSRPETAPRRPRFCSPCSESRGRPRNSAPTRATFNFTIYDGRFCAFLENRQLSPKAWVASVSSGVAGETANSRPRKKVTIPVRPQLVSLSPSFPKIGPFFSHHLADQRIAHGNKGPLKMGAERPVSARGGWRAGARWYYNNTLYCRPLIIASDGPCQLCLCQVRSRP